MIVLDEQLEDPRIIASIRSWYRGRVWGITQLRPGTVIKDDAIPSLLSRVRQPCFVTINVSDFWRIVPASPRYCVVAIDLPITGKLEVSQLLRNTLRVEGLRTRADRAGKVVRARPRTIELYGRPIA